MDTEWPENETPETIGQWADHTFGIGTYARVAARANEEMAELLVSIIHNDQPEKTGAEIADVLICLYRLARNLGIDPQQAVNAKMRINRQRDWISNGDGTGRHR